MGGIPGEFERLVLEALSIECGLSEEQFFFPSEGILFAGEFRALWFSDQTEAYLHPAQMAHPESVAILRRLAARLGSPRPSRFDKIYVSRVDAARRRVSNENQVISHLARFGFEPVVLADFSVREQISLITGAQYIVGPHGMGLTHVTLHSGAPTLVELHNPAHGTDAYALLAKSMGFSYEAVVGEQTDAQFDDFRIPLEPLTAAIERCGVSNGETALSTVTILPTPDSEPKSSIGLQHVSIDQLRSVPEPPPIPEGQGTRHVRGDPLEVKDSNVGAWSGIVIEGSRLYTASCWVWIPREFRGSAAELSIGEWPNQRRQVANTILREQWQRVSSSKTSPAQAKLCNIVLRLTCPAGDYIYSSDWRLESGLGHRERPIPSTTTMPKSP
jgi:hypothetical protein